MPPKTQSFERENEHFEQKTSYSYQNQKDHEKKMNSLMHQQQQEEHAQRSEYHKNRGFKQSKMGGSVAGLALSGTPGVSNMGKYNEPVPDNSKFLLN